MDAAAGVPRRLKPGVMSPLVDQLRGWSQVIVTDELDRLARRAPQLSDTDLQVIRDAMRELVEDTLVLPAQHLPQRASQLRQLFGLDERDPEGVPS